MLSLENLSLTFDGASSPVLRNVSLKLPKAHMALVCGPTGSGKSSLLKCINGLAPTFTGGVLGGRVVINEQTVTSSAPHDLAHLVGYVNQQPEGAFVGETVEDELVFGMEQLGYSRDRMQKRLAEVAAYFELESILLRELNSLSGGQQQKVAIAAAVAAGQKLLLLDEPTSALSPKSAEDTLRLLRRLADDHGLTILLAEHRLERALGIVDSVVMVHGDGAVTQGDSRSQFTDKRCRPPLVELSYKLAWQPIAIDISDAKGLWQTSNLTTALRQSAGQLGDIAVRAQGLSVTFAEEPALKGVSFELHNGTATALIGPNGAGKTTLLNALCSQVKLSAGEVRLAKKPLSELNRLEIHRSITLVPQKATDLLFMNTIGKELSESDRLGGHVPGSTAKILTQIFGRLDPNLHPRDLSAGQQLSLVLAIQLVNGAQTLLLDEPTRGLDYEAKHQLVRQLKQLQESGKCILVATHDIEFAAQLADRVLVLESGEIIQDLAPEELFSSGKRFETQVAKVAERYGILTVNQVSAK